MPALARRFPEHINTYWEPFVGGGAVFFQIADRIERAHLSDANEELVITYKIVKSKVSALIEHLKEHVAKHDKDYYYKIREQEPKKAVEIAARFIYLNKTGYNGLYRVNSSGKFNVPIGRQNTLNICDENALRTASKALKKATIKLGSFEKVVKPGADDFIYCDPPYDECFTEYQAGGFIGADQQSLRDCALQWSKVGANVMVSNSDTELMRKLYTKRKGFVLESITAPRSISCKSGERTRAGELIITSYE